MVQDIKSILSINIFSLKIILVTSIIFYIENLNKVKFDNNILEK
jgi:hypothetical protein